MQQVVVEDGHVACGRDVGGGRTRVGGGRSVGHEVVTVRGVGVHLVGEGAGLAVVGPLDGAAPVKEDVVRASVDGRGGQVVDIAAMREVLVEDVAAVAVDGDLRRVREAHGAELVVGEFVDAVVSNADLHPPSLSQRGAAGIELGVCARGRGGKGPEGEGAAYRGQYTCHM